MEGLRTYMYTKYDFNSEEYFATWYEYHTRQGKRVQVAASTMANHRH